LPIGAIILWNVLFFSDFFGFTRVGEKLSIGYRAITALSLVFLSTFLLLISPRFREMILKEGRGLEHLKVFIYFLLFISGFMLVGFSTILNFL